MAAYNEEGKIGKTICRIPNYVDEIVVIDDSSIDNTFQEAINIGATVISHEKNLGAGAAYRSGYLYGLEKNYDIIVELAGDNQDYPEELHRLLNTLILDDYDYVHGSRWLKKGRRINHPFHRSSFTIIYSCFMSIVTLSNITDGTNGFRAFKASILTDKRINLKQNWLNRYELEPYLYYYVIILKYRFKEMPVTKYYPTNKIGYTKMVAFKDWWSILRPLILIPLGIKK